MAGRRSVIFLTGFSGTGKSSAGRIVAERLGWEMVDTDELITRRSGMPIVDIFELGEDRFRQLEREVLLEVAGRERVVVSTGGGMPVDERNRAVMRAAGVTVLLTASPATIQRRVREGWRATGEPGGQRGLIRPMIEEAGDDSDVASIRRLLAQREPAYATADATVDTEGLTPGEVAERVVEAWERLASGTRAQR